MWVKRGACFYEFCTVTTILVPLHVHVYNYVMGVCACNNV